MVAVSDMLFAVLRGPDLRFEYVNQAYAQLAPDRSLVGVSFREAFPSAAEGGAEAALRRVLESGAPWHIDPSGPPIGSVPGAMWEGEAVRLPGPAGEPGAIALYVRDNSPNLLRQEELARTDEALRKTNATLEATLDTITDGVLVMDRDWRYTYVSKRAGEIVGMPPESLVGGRVWDLFPHARGTKFYDGYHRAMATMQPVKLEEYYPEPLHQWIECYCFPAAESLTVYFRDVTKRRRGEEALQQSTSVLKAISDASDDVIYAKDREGRLLFANPATLELVGKPAHEVLGHTDVEFLENEAAARQVMVNDRHIMETAAPTDVEEVVPRPSGEPCTWHSRKMPIRDEAGSVVGLLGISRDITKRKHAEEALRASEERFRGAMETMIDGCAILSPDWTYLFVNKANAEQARSTPEDMVGRSMLEVIPGVEKSPFFGAFRRCMEERTPQRMEQGFTFADGSSAWFGVTASPVAEGILLRVQDITVRKRDELALRESEELVRTIAENSTQALLMMDGAGYCTYSNPALLAMTGYTADELRSRPLHDLIHHHHPDGRPYPMAECPIHRALLESFDVRAHEDLFFRKDGTSFSVLCAASPIVKGGRSVGTVLEVRDVTERKRAEEALLEANRRKDHFLAVLSHELRNPLAPIKNGLHILDRAPAGGEQARRARAVIERQVDQLSHLVDDLLDVTRMARGKVQLQRRRLELNELVRRTLEDHHSLFKKAELVLEVEPLPQQVLVDADWNRIAQVVGNLLLNAAKFTPPRGRVTVALSADASARQAVLRVSDTGAGIAPELLPQLFEPFVQADATLDRSQGGLGLGLALVKGLVEQHGGTVAATSEGPGRGAEFTMRLPLAMAVQPAADVAGAAVRKLQRRVLIIEDNKDAADTLQEVLELDGHEVAVAYSGPEGLAKAREFHPDLVLCDIGLPGMDGYTVARLFRADEELKHAHLVALSGYALPEDLQRAAEAGFERHLAKPPTLEKIEKVVREVR